MSDISVSYSEWDSEHINIRYNNIQIELKEEESIELAKQIIDTLGDLIVNRYDYIYKHLDKIKKIKEDCNWIEKYTLDQKIEDERFEAEYGK